MSNTLPFHPQLELIEEVGCAMMERWPKAFEFPRQPLAVGLGPVILAALASDPPNGPPWDTMTCQQLAMAVDIVLEAWTSQPRYWAATRAGHQRIGLDGARLGKVLSAEEVWARDQWRKAFLDGPLIPTPQQVREWIDTGQWVGLPGQVWSRPRLPRPWLGGCGPPSQGVCRACAVASAGRKNWSTTGDDRRGVYAAGPFGGVPPEARPCC
jgi:hypothetical protein